MQKQTKLLQFPVGVSSDNQTSEQKTDVYEAVIYMYYAFSSIGGRIGFHRAACLDVDLILLMRCQTARFHPSVYSGVAFVCSSNEVELEMHIALSA